MKMKIKVKKLVILSALLLSIFSAFIASDMVFAGAWKSGGGYSGGSGGGGSGPNCPSFKFGYQNAKCGGMAWGFYKFVGNSSDAGKEITFKPGMVKIGGACAESKPGIDYGFWLVGYFYKYNAYNDPLTGNLKETDGWGNWGYYDAKEGYSGLTGYADTGTAKITFWQQNLGTPYHGVKRTQWGSNMYELKELVSGNDTTGMQRIMKAYEVANEEDGGGWPAWTSVSNPPLMYAFCGTPDGTPTVTPTNAGITSTSTVSTSDGQSKETKNDQSDTLSYTTTSSSVTLNFSHTVYRNGGDSGVSAKVTSTVKRTGNKTGTFTHSSTFGKGPFTYNSSSVSVNVPEGGSITVCEKITHPTNMDSTGVTSGSGSSQICVEISRREDVSICGNENQARLKAANSTNNQSWDSTMVSSSTSGSIWAKPGDAIQYIHEGCAGANKAIVDYNNDKNKKYTTCSYSWYDADGKKHTSHYTCWKGDYYEIKYTASSHTEYFESFGTNSRNSGSYLFKGTSPFTGSTPISWTTGSNYQKTIKSPTGSYSVGVDDTGSTINHSLKWRYLHFSPSSTSPTVSGGSKQTLSAEVKIPYNYRLSGNISTAETSGLDHVLAGANLGLKFKISVNARQNKQVGASYSTKTKPTKYRVFSFVASADSTSVEINNSISTTCKSGSPGECKGGFLSNSDPSSGKTIIEKSDNLVMDAGTTDKMFPTSSSKKFVIPTDAPIGSKYCVAVTMWPADSHGQPTSDTIDDSSQTNAFNDSVTSKWFTTPLTCFTVSKKPSFAVQGLSMHVGGDVKTSVSQRSVSSGEYRIFGSWIDYALITGGETYGFASGSTLYGGIVDGSFSISRQCRFSPLTLANKSCASRVPGGVQLSNQVSSAPADVVQALKSRYTLSGVDTGVGDMVNMEGLCEFNTATQRYEKRATGSGYICLENGAAYSHSNGTLILGDKNNLRTMLYGVGDDYINKTFVIHSDSKVIITENAYYVNNTATSTSVARTIALNTPNEIPQIIVIAPEVDIWGEVTNIDSWIVADKLNTCTKVNGTAYSDNELSSQVCNKELRINGPVYVKELILPRTFGGEGSVSGDVARPAENIFMTPFTFLWLYNQSERYQQAATTYQRELSPRY